MFRAGNEDKVSSPFFSGKDAFLGYWTWPSEWTLSKHFIWHLRPTECGRRRHLFTATRMSFCCCVLAAMPCQCHHLLTTCHSSPACPHATQLATLMQPKPAWHAPPAAVKNGYQTAFLPITPAQTEQEKHQVRGCIGALSI